MEFEGGAEFCFVGGIIGETPAPVLQDLVEILGLHFVKRLVLDDVALAIEAGGGGGFGEEIVLAAIHAHRLAGGIGRGGFLRGEVVVGRGFHAVMPA